MEHRRCFHRVTGPHTPNPELGAHSASLSEELRHAKQAAGADISMLRRQLEKTEEVAAEKLDEECSKRDAAEARALTAEKQARLAAQKARAAEEALQGERSARENAEAEIEASRRGGVAES